LNSARDGEQVAVVCLDLDRFKEVNDTFGHAVGDLLMQTVATRLREQVPIADTVSRTGGDEFAIVHVAVGISHSAAALAGKLIEALSKPFLIDGREVTIGTSVGIALAPSDGSQGDVLLRYADIALYRAKADERGTYRFFETSMNARMQERRQLEHDLREAIARGELELHYQPLVSSTTNQVVGVEALVRWNHLGRGRVPPGDFIPLAEECGLIVALGEWVLRRACTDAAAWPSHIKVAVNLSPLQFKSRALTAMVFNALAAAGLPPARLELEITESALLQDSYGTLDVMRQLREMGVRIALDDFGTGYSSLSYLRSFPFNKIKIDRCFVRDLSRTGGQSRAIFHAITELATNLGIATTAEGVETEEQADIVRAEGCSEMQGFLFSPPKPRADIEALFFSDQASSHVAA
jgi:diguanylate cyclase (GGDEF)-like protein